MTLALQNHAIRRRAPRPRLAAPDLFGLGAAGLGTLEGVLLAAAVALAPINYLRLNFIYITASDIAAAAVLLILLARGRLPLTFLGPATGLWLIGLLCFSGGLAIGSLLNGDPGSMVRVLAQYGFTLLVVPLILGARPPDQVLALTKVLIASVIFVMLFGIYVVYFVHDPSPGLVAPNGRMRSLVERTNECGALGAIAITLVLGLYMGRRLSLAWVAFGLPVLLYGVFLTGSVTGLVLSAFGLLLILAFSTPARQRALALAIGAIASVVIWAGGASLLPEIFRTRVLAPLSQADIQDAGTFTDRYALIIEALKMSRHTLLVGLGADQYREASAFNVPVHNTFLLALTEGGLLSVLGLFGLFLAGGFLVWGAARSYGMRGFPALTGTILIIYFVMLNTFPAFYARFWGFPLMLALLLSGSLLPAVSVHRRVRRRARGLQPQPQSETEEDQP